MIRWLVYAMLIGSFANASTMAASMTLGQFSSGELTGWEEEEFEGKTDYALVDEDDSTVLQATSVASASGLVLERHIDLVDTPILVWRWRIDGPVNPPDETVRSGDDFAARIYFVTPGDGLFAFPDSISYVWASQKPVGTDWPNPFTGKVRMVAVESGSAHAGQWRSYRRNMRDDFRRLFGRDITEVTHIALMTDTDNSGGAARAWYGDIRVEADSSGR